MATIPCDTRKPIKLIQGVLGFGSFAFVVAGRKTRGAGAGDQLVGVNVLEKYVVEERVEKEVRYGPDTIDHQR